MYLFRSMCYLCFRICLASMMKSGQRMMDLTFEAGFYGTLDGEFRKLAAPGTDLVLLAGDALGIFLLFSLT